MGIESLKPVQKITGKVNEAVGKVTNSKFVNKLTGGMSQVLRRFPTPVSVSNIPDALRSTQWEALFPSLPIYGISYVPICEDITFTFPEIETQQFTAGPSKVNLPIKRTTATTFSATFYCDNNATILSYFNTWQSLVVRPNQTVGLAFEYKKAVYLYLLGFKSVMPVYLIKFKGVFPTKLTQWNFKGDSKADRIKATITFCCDQIEAEPLSTGQLTTALTNNAVGNLLSNFGSISSLGSVFGLK